MNEIHDVTFDSAKMNNKQTVHDATYDLLRSLGLTTVFGNPGSTEQTFLQRFPDDFTYVLALQEASALAMADGFAQTTGKPALVNVHTAAGTGNAMGNLVAAYRANTPLIVTAGQQTREMVLCDPYLTNRDETLMPLPWVKWAYQPARAEDVPAAFMRAYAVAIVFTVLARTGLTAFRSQLPVTNIDPKHATADRWRGCSTEAAQRADTP